MKKMLLIIAALLTPVCFVSAQTPPAAPPQAKEPSSPPQAVAQPPPTPRAPTPFDPTTGLPISQSAPDTIAPPAPRIDPTTGLPIPQTAPEEVARRRYMQEMYKRYGVPISAAPQPANALAAGALEEEGNLDLPEAIRSYQSIVSRFDARRPEAANAIFRLGECYRKLGRMEEAKVEYARILREFPDQADLAKLSEKHLFEPTPGGAVGQSGFQQRLERIVNRAPRPESGEQRVTSDRQGDRYPLPRDKKLLAEQIQLVQERIKALQKSSTDWEPQSDQAQRAAAAIFDLKMQLIQLQGQLAAMEKPSSAAETQSSRPMPGSGSSDEVAHQIALIQQQINLVQDKLKRVEAMRRLGRASEDSIDEVKMQLLSLKRELADWEAKAPSRRPGGKTDRP
jgi:tetratricopeptide (TPR) repeat protein